MKQFIILLISIAVMSGCITSQRYASFIGDYYRKKDTSIVAAGPTIKIASAASPVFDSVARVNVEQSYFIPAIFYWGGKSSFNCDLNSRIPAHIFSQQLYKYADSLGLTSKLNGRRIEISIDSLPGKFLYSSRQDVIFLLIAAVTVANQSVYPAANSLTISYKVYDDRSAAKQGRIIIPNDDKVYTNNVKSAKKASWAYLAQYEWNMRSMSRLCIMKLAAEL